MSEKNYSELKGKMHSCGLTQRDLAQQIHISHCTLSLKLNGKTPFTQSEIWAICNALGISSIEIGHYFFTQKA